MIALAACAHRGAPPPEAPASAAPTPSVPDPAPGATPNEKGHALEAQWSEIAVKARKDAHAKEVVSSIRVVKPKLRIFHAAPPPDEAKAKEGEDGESGKPPVAPRPDETIDLGAVLRKLTPLDVDHIDVLDGQVAFIDTSRRERPELWLHDLELSVENLTTRVHLTEGLPVLMTASATVANGGTLSLFVTVDPFEHGLTFSGRVALVGLRTADLYRFIEPATDLQAPEGSVDMFIEFDCRNGELTGGVKPVLKNVKIRPDDKGPFTVLKAWIADAAVKLVSDRVPGRNAVTTVVPIRGTLTGPDVQVWPAIFGVMRNAFVQGLTSGFAYLPPPTAESKEGVVTQGVKALTGPQPPRAQPTDTKGGAPARAPEAKP
ncbi:MAG TPA: DUF748 domain-containing protein [Polyangia bacterium]